MTTNRIYLLLIAGTPRLVTAPNKATATSHVVRDAIKVSVASQADLVRLVSAGCRVEKAGEILPVTTGAAALTQQAQQGALTGAGATVLSQTISGLPAVSHQPANTDQANQQRPATRAGNTEGAPS